MMFHAVDRGAKRQDIRKGGIHAQCRRGRLARHRHVLFPRLEPLLHEAVAIPDQRGPRGERDEEEAACGDDDKGDELVRRVGLIRVGVGQIGREGDRE